MNNININIQAHKKRKNFIPYLKRKLGNVTVVWDKENDVWETRERCLKNHIKANKRWSLTIQDDALIPDDFIEKVQSFLAMCEEKEGETFAVNFYFGMRDTNLVNRLRKLGHFKKRGMTGGVAICLPTKILPDILKMWEGSEEFKKHDDSRIGKFLQSRMIETFYPVPSIVQHRDSESLIYKPGEMPEVRKAIVYDKKQFD